MQCTTSRTHDCSIIVYTKQHVDKTVTTAVLIVKKTILMRHPCAGVHVNLSVSFHGRSTNCATSLRQSHAIFTVLTKKRSHAKSFHHCLHSRFMRVSLAQGSCQILQILDVSSEQGPCYSSPNATVCTCHPCKRNVQPIPCRRENRHSYAGSPIICGRLFRDIRTFGRAVEGSSVSPLTNTMGGLSGGGRGGDTQQSVPLLHSSSPGFVPELWPWIWAVAPAVLPFVIRKEYTIEGSSNPTTKELSHA